MILPNKHLLPERALLTIGSEVLAVLREPATVSRLWDDLRKERVKRWGAPLLSFEWFILALDLLHALGTIEWDGHRVRRTEP